MLGDGPVGAPAGRGAGGGRDDGFKLVGAQLLQRNPGLGWGRAGGQIGPAAMPVAPVFAAQHGLRGVNAVLAIPLGNLLLPGGVRGRGEAVHPADVIPIPDVKRLHHRAFGRRLALERGQPLVSRRTGAAALRRVQLDHRGNCGACGDAGLQRTRILHAKRGRSPCQICASSYEFNSNREGAFGHGESPDDALVGQPRRSIPYIRLLHLCTARSSPAEVR